MVSIICSSFLFGPSSFCDCRKLSLNCLTEAETTLETLFGLRAGSLVEFVALGLSGVGFRRLSGVFKGLGFRVYWCVQGSDISAGRGCFGHNAKLKVAA